MKLGMPQLYEFDNIEDNFILAKRLGLDFIELNLNFENTRIALKKNIIKELKKKYELELTLHFYDETDFAGYPEVTQAYLTLLEKYMSDDFLNLNVHLNHGPIVTIKGEKNYLYQKNMDKMIDDLLVNLSKVKAICDKHNAKLTIENTDSTPLFLREVYKVLKEEGYKFCYDIGHDYMSGYNMRSIQENLNLVFGEFHFHDAGNKKCHLALKDGELDLTYYKRLAANSDGLVNIEVKSSDDLIKSVEIFNTIEID